MQVPLAGVILAGSWRAGWSPGALLGM